MRTVIARAMRLVQWALVALGLVMVFFPAMRPGPIRFAASLLLTVCFFNFVYRLRREGTAGLTLPEIWHRIRTVPQGQPGAVNAIGPLELLSMFMGVVAINLP